MSLDKPSIDMMSLLDKSSLDNINTLDKGDITSAMEVFLLDLFPGAKAAYSLRRLKTGQLFAIRVKRTSDDAEQDIGFLSNGDLDTGSLVSFVGASDGLITILYDQSGNGVDLDAPLPDLQLPKIIIAGVLQTSNNIPSLFFDGINDVLLVSTVSLVSPVSHLFVFGVWQKLDLSNRPLNFNLNAPELTTRVSVHAPWITGEIFWDAGNTTTDRLITPLSIYNDLIQHEWTFIKTAGTDNQKIKRDKIQLAQKTQVTSPTVLNDVSIGDFDSVVVDPAHMQFQELIFYDTDEFSNVIPIEDDIINYWLSLGINWVNGLNKMVNGANNLVFASGV